MVATRAMVFAAGLGTRLRPLTEILPKPVVPLLHRPLAWYALDHLARAGIEHAVLNTHHLGDRVRSELERAPRIEGLELDFAPEPELLGTGGGLAAALAHQARRIGPLRAAGAGMDEEVVIAFNGDVFFAPDLARAIAHHRARGAYATMVLRADPEARRYGAIEIDGDGIVRRMLGRPLGPPEGRPEGRSEGGVSEALRALMFTGVHVLSARAVADLPERGCIVRQGYERWLARGEIVAGHVEDAPWRDLGTPREYLAASLDLLAGRARWPSLPDPRAIAVDPSASIGPGAVLEDAIVGAGAVVAEGARIRRAVVWPGARVRGSAQDSILFDDSVMDAR